MVPIPKAGGSDGPTDPVEAKYQELGGAIKSGLGTAVKAVSEWHSANDADVNARYRELTESEACAINWPS
jgi:hypothetical protein